MVEKWDYSYTGSGRSASCDEGKIRMFDASFMDGTNYTAF